MTLPQFSLTTEIEQGIPIFGEGQVKGVALRRMAACANECAEVTLKQTRDVAKRHRLTGNYERELHRTKAKPGYNGMTAEVIAGAEYAQALETGRRAVRGRPPNGSLRIRARPGGRTVAFRKSVGPAKGRFIMKRGEWQAKPYVQAIRIKWGNVLRLDLRGRTPRGPGF